MFSMSWNFWISDDLTPSILVTTGSLLPSLEEHCLHENGCPEHGGCNDKASQLEGINTFDLTEAYPGMGRFFGNVLVFECWTSSVVLKKCRVQIQV